MKAVSKSGPVAMALRSLASIGWIIEADGSVDDGLGRPFAFWESPRRFFLPRLDLAWNRAIEARIQILRKDFRLPLSYKPVTLDLAATRSFSFRLSTRDRGLIFFHQTEAQPTNLSMRM